MKIQCACGAKYAFDVQPEMLAKPVQFVCPTCGLDSSAFVNSLVRQELGVAAPAAEVLAIAPPSISIAPPPQPAAASVAFASVGLPAEAPPPAPRVRLRSGPEPAEAPAAAGDSSVCSRHYGQPTVEFCHVCHKPICAKCMELFGYVCSPLCKQKAELKGIKVREFAGQRDVVQRRFWRKVSFVSSGIGAFVVFLLGVWFWWVWFGSTPKPVFSVRFAEPSYSGQSAFCGKDQIVFLHGGTLARHDMKAKKEIWSRELIDPAKIDRQVAETLESLRKAQQRRDSDFPDADPIKIPSPEKLTKSLTRAAGEELELYVRGQNVWLSSYEKVVRYDWETGKPVQEIPLRGGLGGALARGDEMWLIRENESGQNFVTRLNLATGQMQTEGIGVAIPQTATLAAGTSVAASGTAAPVAGAKPLDPDKIAAQAQRLPLPARIALPATLSVGVNQQRALTELNGPPPTLPASEPDYGEHFELMPTRDGFVQFSVQLLERKMIERSAMKAAPAKSALDGPVSVTATTEIANEILNEMQRERGGGTLMEDQSRYQVTVRIPGAKDVPDWKGEVIGSPKLYPLKTVNAIAAGKTLAVLDQSNKKKWQATLSYEVADVAGSMDEADAPFGLGPVVERDGALFVIDEGMLTAFDLATGNARWRLPSVGIAGLFFDDEGKIYVNSTTAGPDRIKFSRQIDISERVNAVVLKIDPKNGKILWTAEPGGQISHVSGKFIFVINWFQPDDEKEDNLYMPDTGLETPPYMRIKRINPRNGRVMWEHFQQRAPLDVQFEGNIIRLVFKKEVQVLKFLSL